MPIHWPAKDPNDNPADFQLDWSGKLDAGDTIQSSAWTINGSPTSIQILAQSSGPTATRITVSGGTEFQTYIFRNTVTTVGGDVLSRQASLWIKGQ